MTPLKAYEKIPFMILMLRNGYLAIGIHNPSSSNLNQITFQNFQKSHAMPIIYNYIFYYELQKD